MSSSQLIKILNIWAAIVEGYVEGNTLISLFTRGWYPFVVEKEDCITDITLKVVGLPSKIQSFMD